MMASRTVAPVLEDLRRRVGGLAAALVARDGAVLFADLSEGLFAETFAIMCATMVGAGVAANAELGQGPPERIVIEAADTRTLIVSGGTGAILVVVVDLSADLSNVREEVGRFTDLLGIG